MPHLKRKDRGAISDIDAKISHRSSFRCKRRASQFASISSTVLLVLGAWGCGVFGNDPLQTAKDFRSALEGDFAGAFKRVVFAITDWSDQRWYLRPFSEVFSAHSVRLAAAMTVAVLLDCTV